MPELKFYRLTIKKIKEIKEVLQTPKKIVIVTHWSPDGDAMGSSLGLYNFLLRKNHMVRVITPNDYPSFLAWLPGNKEVIKYSTQVKEAKKNIEKAELIFCLDFNSLKRIEKLGPIIEKSKAKKFIVDHHPQPENFADFMLHDVNACSTAELVMDLINLLGEKKLLNKDIANCLYTGIMTDTGSFRFPSTTAKTHYIVAELIEAGAENSIIHDRIYDNNSQDKINLLGFCLYEKLKVFEDFHTAFISLSMEELKRFNYIKGDTEGVVNYALSIKGIHFAAFFVERDGIIKTSFRSKGNFNVNLFARNHFEGGGHIHAAGGSCNLSLDETINKFISLLPQFKEELNFKFRM